VSDLTTIADELYGLTPIEFTAARNARAKESVALKVPGLADAIRRLPKPAVSAWVINTLVRQRGDEVGEVLRLGAAMREAQAELDRDGLAKLGQQRRQLMGALARSAGELAAALGHRVSSATEAEVEQTLLAAMADERAARALLTGRLLRALESVGFEEVDLADAVAAPEGVQAPAPAAAASDRDGASTRDLARARTELDSAKQHVDGVAAELASLDGRIAHTVDRRERLEEEVTELRAQLERVDRDIRVASEEHRTLERERDQVRRASAEAERVAERARARLGRLGRLGRLS